MSLARIKENVKFTIREKHLEGELIFAGFLLILGLFLIASPEFLSASTFHWIYSEAGPFETWSEIGWVLLGGLIMWGGRKSGIRGYVLGGVCLLLAMREADFHTAFTEAGVFKINYYLGKGSSAPIMERMLAGLAVFIMCALLIYAAYLIYHYVVTQRGWRNPAGWWLTVGALAIVGSKVIDRAPALLKQKLNFVLAESTKMHFTAVEEGMEAALPIIFGWALYRYYTLSWSETERS